MKSKMAAAAILGKGQVYLPGMV